MPQSLSAVDYAEVPYYMIDRNLVTEQAESFSLFDLSNFEMVGGTSGCNKINKVSAIIEKEKYSCFDESSERLPAPLEEGILEKNLVTDESPERPQNLLEESRIDKDPVAGVKADRQAPFDGSACKMSQEIWVTEDTCKIPKTTDSCCVNTPMQTQKAFLVDPGKNERRNLGTSNGAINQESGKFSQIEPQVERTPFVGCSGSFKQISTKMSGCSDYPVTVAAAKEFKVIKEEFEEKAHPNLKDQSNDSKVVTMESVDSVGQPSPNLVNFCFTVSAVTQSWLELPTEMEALARSYRGRARSERKIILLRDSAMRLWPVLYHERSGFKVLTSGWEAFAQANNVQQGDICVFGFENKSEDLFQVRIAKKSGIQITQGEVNGWKNK
ncbi:PREDICTED: uncharacterized protein LOC104592989 isoform X1 [Nelumbo nucifera]|uniref:Uncharacterized protein LOC104592989 isoform X1 n=1 Tax=Nelumbo nucifera TaxID=4432 RepID=A0A1U7ZBH6_NELNU|nr:PREDICTED: uncharacterized protein LOC104592989 isoform X1 [Nelumbo nucifera]